METQKIAEFMGINRVTINRILRKIRERITEICELESPFINDEIELDERYFETRQ